MKIKYVWGDITDISAKKEPLRSPCQTIVPVRRNVSVSYCCAVMVSSKLNRMFFGCFNPINVLFG